MGERPSRVDAAQPGRGRRIAARLGAVVDDVGRFLVAGPGGAGAAIDGWRAAPRPPVRELWLERDARRDEWVQPLAPIDAMVSDGLLIAHVAVRMSVKNHVLVAALREHADFDPQAIGRFAGAELLRLAEEHERSAERLAPIVEALPDVDRRSLAERLERDQQVRRPAVHRAIAVALRDASTEPALLDAIVQQAAYDAADEFGRAVAASAARSAARHPDDETGRAARLRLLVEKDLKALRRNSASRPRPRSSRWATTRRDA